MSYSRISGFSMTHSPPLALQSIQPSSTWAIRIVGRFPSGGRSARRAKRWCALVPALTAHALDFVRKSDGTFYYWFAASELEQARRQLTAAAGAPIEWIVAEPELKLALENLFELHNITGIPIRVVPAR
jgi:hypothetical protein